MVARSAADCLRAKKAAANQERSEKYAAFLSDFSAFPYRFLREMWNDPVAEATHCGCLTEGSDRYGVRP